MARSRIACRTDDNQQEIVSRYREHGFSVAVTSNAGDGFPDLVVGIKALNFLVEVKDGSKPPSGQKLTKEQEVFHADWRGSIRIVRSIDDVDHHVHMIRRFVCKTSEPRRQLFGA